MPEIPQHYQHPMMVDLEYCETNRALIVQDIISAPGKVLIYTDGGTICITGVDQEGLDFLGVMRTERED